MTGNPTKRQPVAKLVGHPAAAQERVAMGKWQQAKSCGRPFEEGRRRANDAGAGAAGGQAKNHQHRHQVAKEGTANQQFPPPWAASSPSDGFVPLAKGLCVCVLPSPLGCFQIKVAPKAIHFTAVSAGVKGFGGAGTSKFSKTKHFLCRSWERQRHQARRPPGSSKSMGKAEKLAFAHARERS